jgi:hypothetical protein
VAGEKVREGREEAPTSSPGCSASGWWLPVKKALSISFYASCGMKGSTSACVFGLPKRLLLMFIRSSTGKGHLGLEVLAAIELATVTVDKSILLRLWNRSERSGF